jgi:hypothetical protein
MCLRRAPEKYIAGAALDRAALSCLYNRTIFAHLYHKNMQPSSQDLWHFYALQQA